MIPMCTVTELEFLNLPPVMKLLTLGILLLLLGGRKATPEDDASESDGSSEPDSLSPSSIPYTFAEINEPMLLYYSRVLSC